MANTQINITANGTKTLATAGKYCDRNIDVNVAVPGKATQFANLYDPANVVLKKTSNCSGGTVSFNDDKYANYVIIPYHHKEGDEVAIRTRGLSVPVRDRQSFTCFDSDGTTVVSWGQLSSAVTVSYDEYGDGVLTFKNGSYKTKEWYYLHLNFQYEGINSSASTAYTGPIITINEPIGNGGYVG